MSLMCFRRDVAFDRNDHVGVFRARQEFEEGDARLGSRRIDEAPDRSRKASRCPGTTVIHRSRIPSSRHLLDSLRQPRQPLIRVQSTFVS
jgi:hypothetical protein